MDANTHTLGEMVRLYIQQNNLSYGLYRAQLPTLWAELMGAPVAKYTSSVVLKGTTLFVRLTSPALTQELSYGKSKIISTLNEALGSEVIQKLVFLH